MLVRVVGRVTHDENDEEQRERNRRGIVQTLHRVTRLLDPRESRKISATCFRVQRGVHSRLLVNGDFHRLDPA